LNATRFAMAAMVAVLVSGCNALGDRSWIAQGPGDIPEVVRAKRQGPAVAQAPAARAAAPASTVAPAAGLPGSLAAYTQASRYGDLVFISGQIAIEPVSGEMRGATIEEQTRQVMENIRVILEAHRLNMANVVSTTVYMKDLKGFRAMDGVYETYFRTTLPSRSVVEVSELPRGALVEISVIAGR
jgi:2-iminobutanoate/2-iminopropanoate deaminase